MHNDGKLLRGGESHRLIIARHGPPKDGVASLADDPECKFSDRIGEDLERASRNRAKVVGLRIRDRAAVPSLFAFL